MKSGQEKNIDNGCQRDNPNSIPLIKRIIIAFLNITNISLIIVISVLAVIIVSALLTARSFTDGYYTEWLTKLLFTNKFASVFLSSAIILFKDNALKFKIFVILFVMLFIILIVIKIYLNKTIKKTIKGKIWRTVLLNIINFSVYCITVFQAIILFLYILSGNYVIEKFGENYFSATFDNTKDGFENLVVDFNNSKVLAGIELERIINDIDNGIINIDKLSDTEYINLANNICSIFRIKGHVYSDKEHYLRNYFSRAPATLIEMIDTILNDNSVFGWQLVSIEETMFHMFGENGEYNLKFVSKDGYFEAVYNKTGDLLTEINDPINMGTFNYVNPITEPQKHSKLDVYPYLLWGNTENSKFISIANEVLNREYEAPQLVYGNMDAEKHYYAVYEKLYGKKQ
jgi:hypothetical protein